ncbi:MAG: HEPN domain-containing protein [Actinobacteria bacterium]|nr:HEPN domain-containing protein [Actinomycetota bacterium]
MLDLDGGSSDWLDQARLTLVAAEQMLVGGLAEEAIADSFLAMVYAARAALQGGEGEVLSWEDVIARFQGDALPGLGLSKENQRALPIVSDLYWRVAGSREMEADPLTAGACLEDARSFVDEVARKLEG